MPLAFLTLQAACVAYAPQQEDGEGGESGAQKVAQGCEVRYGVGVGVFSPPPQTVDHAVGQTQQQEDLREAETELQPGGDRWTLAPWRPHLKERCRQVEEGEEETGDGQASFHQVNRE